MRINRSPSVMTVALMLGSAPTALAQQPAGPEPTLALEEVVVTARKREESLQDVPLAISAFDAQALDRLGIQNPADIAAFTPGLFYQDVGYRAGEKPSIRGLTTASLAPSQQKASVFIDGVYVNGSFSSQSLVDLDRIEVLKGPQSAFFGRSTFAGAINYITREPGEQLSARATGMFASDAETQLSALIGGPLLGGRVLAQLSGYLYEYEGPDEWRNASDGQRLGNQESRGVAATFVVPMSDTARLKVRASYGEDDDGHLNAVFLNSRNGQYVRPGGAVYLYPTGTIEAPPQVFNYNLDRLAAPGVDRESFRTSAHLTWNVAAHEVSLTAGHNEQEANIEADFDLVAPLNAFLFRNLEDFRDTSVDLRLASTRNGRVRYLLGAYYLDLTSDIYARNGFFGAPPPTTRTLTEAENESIYGGVYVGLNDALTLGIEGRYQRDTIAQQNLAGLRFEETFDAFLPRVSVDWRLSADKLVYALYSRGNNPGDFNTDVRLPESVRFVDEETLDNFEVGLKSDWLDGRARLNVAVYHMKWKDQQQRRSLAVSVPGAPQPILIAANVNEGSSTSQGVEVEAAWVPAPSWDLRATLAYQDATFDNFCSQNYFNLTGIESIPGGQCRDVDGNQLEGQPELSGSVGARYQRLLADNRSWYVAADVIYQEGTYASEMNLAKSADALVMNLRVGYDWTRVKIEIFGRNLSDEDAPLRVARLGDFRFGPTTGGSQNVAVTFRRPRQVGARLIYEF